MAPALDDLDGDGRYEMIYVSTDNLLHVFELGSAAGEAAWSQRFGNALNTGLNEQPLLGDGYTNPVSLYQKTRMLGHVALDSTAAPSLYVGHGTEIRVDASVSDPFQLRAFGSVRMKGSSTAPVVIHSDPPASGTATWGGLYVDDRFASATDPDTLVYVELSDASIGVEVHSPLHVTSSEVSNVFDAGIVTDDTLSVKASDIVAFSEIGIELLAGGRGWISDSSVDGTGTGVLAAQGAPLTVRNSTISNVAVAGVVAGDTLWFDRSSVSASSGLGIKLTSGAVARIRQSTVSDTDSTSVLCDSCAYTTTIDSTTVSSSGGDGIHVIGNGSWQGTDGIALDSCTVAASAGAGVRFDGAHGTILQSRLEGNDVGVVTTAGGGLTTIENSTITGGSAGVDHGSPVRITGTTISSIQDVGVASGDTLWVEASEVTTTGGIGIRLGPGAAGRLDDVLVQYTDSTAVLCDSCAAGTVINRANVQSAGLHGIHVIGTTAWVGTAGITIDSCTVDGSSASGIRFDSAHGTISYCSIDGGAEGVYIGSGGGYGFFVNSDISNCDVGVENLSPLAVTNVDIDNATVAGIVAYDTLSVDECQIGGAPGVGIHLRTDAVGFISDVSIPGSDFSAIVCDTCGTGSTVIRTSIDSAGLYGIHAVAVWDMTIDSCVVTNSASTAIRFEQANGLIRRSRLDGNGGGVACFDGSHPVIRECSMDGNGGGVSAADNSFPVVGDVGVGGLNCITHTVGYNVTNLSDPDTPVNALFNHWGAICCKPSKFYGNVVCDSCETASACDAAAAPASVVVLLKQGEAEAGPEGAAEAELDSLGAQNEKAPVLPEKLDLVSAAPNPFNPSVRIRFAVPVGGADVQLTVYNVRGQRVAVLHDGPTPPGYHEAIWHGVTARGAAAASGVYFVRMSAGKFRKTMRLVLLK